METLFSNIDKNREKVVCWFDGACGPNNPGGYLGMGIIVYQGGEYYTKFEGEKKRIINSNNVAEYKAFIMVLERIGDLKGKDITIYGDSNLVIQQMKGLWKIKGGMYKEYALQAKAIMKMITTNNDVSLEWIPRESNEEADNLSNEGILKVCPDYVGFKPYYQKRKKKFVC